ncbi:MAG: tetratricopeptide repeat protein [Bacteroidota bacterium]
MKFLLLAIFLLLKTPAVAQTIDWAKVHSTTAAAIDDLYNLRYAEAEAGCNDVIKQAPGEPRGYFYKAMVYYTRFSNAGDDADYKAFLKTSQQVEQVCAKLLKNNGKDSRAMFYMGGILGYRGLLHYKAEKHLDAVSDGKKAVGFLEDALEADSSNADAKMGLGLFQYLISQAPPFLKPALSLAGLSGDRAKGLRQLEFAAANGIYSKPEARAWLASFYQSEENFPRAQSHLSALVTQFPKNGWFRLQLAQLLLFQMRKSDEAIMQGQKILLIINEIPQPERAKLNVQANFGLGVAHFFKNNYAESSEFLKKVIVDNSNVNLVREANIQLGMMLEISGNRVGAVNYYQKAAERDDVKKLLKKPMTSGDIAVVKADNFFRAGDYDEAISSTNEPLKSNFPDNIKARLEYIAGRAFFEKGSFAEAEKRFLKATVLKPEDDVWVTPFSYYRLGLAQVKSGNKEAALSSFEKAASFKDFEQEEYLQKQVKREISRIK